MARPVYPNAPVQFVTAAVRYSLAPALGRADGREAIYDRLAGDFPILESLSTMRVELAVGPQGPGLPLPSQVAEQVRMTNRGRTMSVTVGPNELLIESGMHKSFEQLLGVIDKALHAVTDVTAVNAVQQLRLRYVDEIRHPATRTPGDWLPLLRSSLIGPLDLLEHEPVQTEGAVMFRISDQHTVRVVFGAHPDGFAVDPDGPLRVRRHAGGPYFRLDTESTWAPSAENVPALVTDDALAVFRDLHEPVSAVFEAAITDDLREFFRRDNEH